MPTNICGLFFIDSARQFLPLVDIKAHTTILATTSRTVLTQTFFNPSENNAPQELHYSFPLYDGVSVVGFICHIGEKTIVGKVKERSKAKKDYKKAVARGDKAALLEQLPDASDVFTTTVGNVPAGSKVTVELTYLGELKHDAEVDGVRFTIPASILPRYGDYPVGLVKDNLDIESNGRIQITVDVALAQESSIKQILSPSHPIAVSVGINSFAPTADPVLSKASATLSLESSSLDKDFILQVIAKDTGIPTAILETHPKIPNHRALMTTLVPRFSLPQEHPEIVFICDCSGSMDGSNIELVKSALKVFLKSLPVGVKFNICRFGSDYKFLWPKSRTYSQDTLKKASDLVQTIEADMGGTEMYDAVEATLNQRHKDIPLEIILITDGDIWGQDKLFSYLNEQVIESQEAIRVFTLGIGSGVSHSLIEGVAKAGNGFSQSVGEGEKMQSKVVRMLKGALSPHITDYTLEVKYSEKDNQVGDVNDDDDFEIVERVTDCLDIKVDLVDESEVSQKKKDPISLYDTSIDPDKTETTEVADDDSGESRFAHLPPLAPPKILQAPHIIPPLYAFNRTTVYLLMDPECSKRTPKSVVLRGNSKHGPVELEIPIQILDTPGETIHQLAAKKAIAELEQGRGWITQVKDSSGELVKQKHSSQYEDMVEREAVRLGVQFQVGGKWCSFVALEIDANQEEKNQEETNHCVEIEEEIVTIESVVMESLTETTIMRSCSMSLPVVKGISWFSRASDAVGCAANSSTVTALTTGVALIGAGVITPAPQLVDGVWKQSVIVPTTCKCRIDEACPIAKTSYVYYDQDGDVYDADLIEKTTGIPHATQLVFDIDAKVYHVYTRTGESDYRMTGPYQTIEEAKEAFQSNYLSMFGTTWTERETAVNDLWDYKVKTYESYEEFIEICQSIDADNSAEISSEQDTETQDASIESPEVVEIPTGPKLDVLIDLQTFEGFWEWKDVLFLIIGVDREKAETLVKDDGFESLVVATALSIKFFEKALAEEEEAWELVVAKAKEWVEKQIGEEKSLSLLQKAEELIVLDQAKEE
ncbi:hypothetical protein BGZ46_010066 [Entomortierella lignicola]|nr:hypothetical protein BGZ46_010066 [Entomortierella lignicola]